MTIPLINPLQRMATPFTSPRVTTSLTSSLRATNSLSSFECSAIFHLQTAKLLHRHSLLLPLHQKPTQTPIFQQNLWSRPWSPSNSVTNSSTSPRLANWKTMPTSNSFTEFSTSTMQLLHSPAPGMSSYTKTSTSATRTWQQSRHDSPTSPDQLTQQYMRSLLPIPWLSRTLFLSTPSRHSTSFVTTLLSSLPKSLTCARKPCTGTRRSFLLLTLTTRHRSPPISNLSTRRSSPTPFEKLQAKSAVAVDVAVVAEDSTTWAIATGNRTTTTISTILSKILENNNVNNASQSSNSDTSTSSNNNNNSGNNGNHFQQSSTTRGRGRGRGGRQ
ncbi:MAG: hypothetical protein JOS17DRAFT_825405 [Linnemannia elongata]|nr:MAG: hypothetical protein JOS17DRAFT_825405 [Linnemannia elongata]